MREQHEIFFIPLKNNWSSLILLDILIKWKTNQCVDSNPASIMLYPHESKLCPLSPLKLHPFLQPPIIQLHPRYLLLKFKISMKNSVKNVSFSNQTSLDLFPPFSFPAVFFFFFIPVIYYTSTFGFWSFFLITFLQLEANEIRKIFLQNFHNVFAQVLLRA